MEPGEIAACPYPNEVGMPMLPNLKALGMSMRERQTMIRRYLRLHSAAYGGGQPSYSMIEEESTRVSGSIIDVARTPPGYSVLRDPRNWKVAETDAWGDWFWASQEGLLHEHEEFGWRKLPGKRDDHSMTFTKPLRAPIKGASIPWKTEELLFGAQVRRTPDAATDKEDSGKSLPLARTNHVYSPYTLEQYQTLLDSHPNQPEFHALLADIALMERDGPIHQVDGICDSAELANPHIPPSTGRSITRLIFPLTGLPVAFFDQKHKDHAIWSLTALKTLLERERPHINKATGTVYGGPRGVRCFVFALSRVKRCVDEAREGQNVQPGLRSVLYGKKASWSADACDELVSKMIAQLRLDLAASRIILQKTVGTRAKAWEESIQQRLKHLKSQGHSYTSERDSGISATSGIPNGWDLLCDMVDALEECSDPTVDVGDASMMLGDHHAARVAEASIEAANNLDVDQDLVQQTTQILDDLELGDTRGTEAESSDHPDSIHDGINETVSHAAWQKHTLNPDMVQTTSITRRRSGRKSIRSERAEQAIRGTRKGTYRRSGD
ncbi:hypothetical protein FRC08_018703 [Ceratobasidium sp. 394]|nr:hypothetical protein FRC08_018703 [Ceratobasidium sp. 394]